MKYRCGKVSKSIDKILKISQNEESLLSPLPFLKEPSISTLYLHIKENHPPLLQKMGSKYRGI